MVGTVRPLSPINIIHNASIGVNCACVKVNLCKQDADKPISASEGSDCDKGRAQRT